VKCVISRTNLCKKKKEKQERKKNEKEKEIRKKTNVINQIPGNQNEDSYTKQRMRLGFGRRSKIATAP